jgi:heptosyltransferase-2
MKLVIFLPNWIGDAVMCTPALRALRRHFGREAWIAGVMRPHIADLLAGTAWLDEQLFYVPASPERALGTWGLIGRLRRAKPDVAALLTNSLRTGLLAFLSGARERVGYTRYGRGPLLTHRLLPPQEDDGRLLRHAMVDYYLDLAYALGCAPESPRLELVTTNADERAADFVWTQLGLRAGRTIVLNSSGAFGAAKLWPVEYFAELARRIVTHLDHDVLVLCGPSERAIAAAIVEQAARENVVSLAEYPLSLGLSKACVRRSRLMVTTDSGPRHFAVAFGVPLVSLFGPTPAIWGDNPTASEIPLSVAIDCFGCHQRTCPRGHHRCMRDLTVNRVFAAVVEQLNADRAVAA